MGEAMRSLIQSECIVTREVMEQADSGAIVNMVRSDLVRRLCEFAVDNQILNSPDCIAMEDDLYRNVTCYRARIYMIPPKELESLLKKAFDAGQAKMYQEMGGF